MVRGPVANTFPAHLMVCTDFSPASAPAIEAAERLCRAFGAKVTLVHVLSARELEQRGGQAAREDLETQLAAALDLLHREHYSAPVQTSVLVASSVPHAIVAHADEIGADLAVVATHGRTGLKRMWIGSVSERVARHAGCSVLVARSPLQSKT